MTKRDSSEAKPSTESHSGATPPVDEAPAGEKKPRSSVERIVVRSGIIILFVVMVVELFASRSFNADLAAAQEALGSGPVTESDIQQLITNHSAVESKDDLTANALVASREDKYSYRGLLKQRKLYVYYGVVLKGEKEAEVLDVVTEPTEFFNIKRGPAVAGGSGQPAAGTAPPTAPPTSPPSE